MPATNDSAFEVFHGPVGVVVGHGFAGFPSTVQAWAQSFADAGMSVSVPLLAGHGSTWQDLAKTTWQDWFASYDMAVQRMVQRCDVVVVAGLSLGATLALRVSQTRPDDVDGLIVVNPAVSPTPMNKVLLPILSRVTSSVPTKPSDVAVARTPVEVLPRIPLTAAVSLTQLWTVVRDDIAAVTADMLLFRSVTDHVVNPRDSAWIRSHVSGRVEQVDLEHSFHLATVDVDAPMVFDHSVQFVHHLVANTSS